MITKVSKFSYRVPTDETNPHPDAGKKFEKPFEYPETESENEAKEVMASKKWSLKELVDELLKANARSNAYQNALLPYKATEVPAEDIKERMIRDYIRLNIPEDVARKQVEATLAALAAGNL